MKDCANVCPSQTPIMPKNVCFSLGTVPPTDLRISKTTVNSVTLSWKAAQVFGTNRLQGHIVRWAEGKFTKSSNKDETDLAHHKTVQTDSNKVLILHAVGNSS